MSYPINYPTPQGANVQIFRGGDDSSGAHVATRDWVKPQGASFVFFVLIGAGGGGGGGMQDSSGPVYYAGGGGGPGNVTKFMVPAFLMPDVLQVAVGRGGVSGTNNGSDIAGGNGESGQGTQLIYQQKDGTGYTLLTAGAGGGGFGANFANGAGASLYVISASGGPMTAAGFYNTTTGNPGGFAGGTSATTSGTTFLMGGNGGSDPTTVITGYYGYTATLRSGYSQLSPIPLSIPALGTTAGSGKSLPQSFGCGGAGGGISGVSAGDGGKGGDGLAIIITW
jgi:hypothetical protein